jgi:hypothetical protein
MLFKTFSAAVFGIDAYLVEVEVDAAYLHYSDLFAGSYAVPVFPDSGLPKLPPGGISRAEDLARIKDAVRIPIWVTSGFGPSEYAYTRQNTRRNLYRIPLIPGGR